MHQEIDSNLKRAYDDVLNQDIPDKFTDLLSRLREAEGESRSVSADATAGRGDDDS